jgi:hypothetical protein
MGVKRTFEKLRRWKGHGQRLVAEFELMARIESGRSSKKICEKTEQFI